jgi:macrodomain Ter protein organizer (MatP/YcbG family)
MKKEKRKNEFVDVEIDLEDDVILSLAKKAHELDITLNEYINQILTEAMENEE